MLHNFIPIIMEKTTAKSLIITYGLLLGILSVFVSVLKFVFSSNIMERSFLESAVGFLLIVAFIVIPIMTYKKSNGTLLSLSDAFKIGLGVSAIGGVIGAVYFFIFANYIQPDFPEKLLNMQMAEAMKNPNVSHEDLQKGMEIAKKFMMPMAYAMIVITNMFFGFLTSLVAGLILRKQQ